MKRFISTLFIGVLLLSTIIFFTGCNNDKALGGNNVSEQHHQYALRAIEISDAYFDGAIDILEAREQMESLYEQETNLPEIEQGEPSDAHNAVIETAVLIMSNEFNIAVNSAAEPSESLLYWRNNLAEIIGEQER